MGLSSKKRKHRESRQNRVRESKERSPLLTGLLQNSGNKCTPPLDPVFGVLSSKDMPIV